VANEHSACRQAWAPSEKRRKTHQTQSSDLGTSPEYIRAEGEKSKKFKALTLPAHLVRTNTFKVSQGE
jgi:hypothetical protein